jgi:hypothetical protein
MGCNSPQRYGTETASEDTVRKRQHLNQALQPAVFLFNSNVYVHKLTILIVLQLFFMLQS